MTPLPLPFSEKPLSSWITQFLQPPSPEDQLRALQAIGRLAPPEQLSELATQALDGDDPTVRALGAKLLGELQLGQSITIDDKIARLLSDDDPDARFEAARALIRRKAVTQGQAISILLQFLDEPETQPLMVAAVLNTLTGAELQPDFDPNRLLPPLQTRIEHERAEVREAVATAFARWPELCPTMADLLLPLLDDSEPVVREKTAAALGQSRLNRPDVREALLAASHDEDAEVARIALAAWQQLSHIAAP